ncbi:MAG: cytochrome c biogenesis CcdA family protein [Planctomycetota bacterium]
MQNNYPAMLFAGKSCGTCEEIKGKLKNLKIGFRYYNIDKTENYIVLIKTEKRLGKESDVLPVLVHKNNFIESKKKILSYLKRLRTKAPSKISNTNKTDTNTDISSTIERKFSKISIAAIAVAGLFDGINPCAFATIAFLVGCLTAAGRSRKKALTVGLSFSTGIFVTYFAIGLGLFHSLFALNHFSVFRNYFHISAILIFFIAGALSLFDAFYTRKNNGIPLFKLPKFLKQKTNHTIARGLHTEKWIAGGFSIGVIVSLLEFACTGQVYIPTILYMINTGTMVSRAYYLFTLYNFMFVLPLLIVLLLCIKGFEAKKLWDILKGRAALSKAVTSALFFFMAFIMWIR